MKAYLLKRWFLVSLLVIIPGGILLARVVDPQTLSKVSTPVSPRWVTALVLFLMAFSLDSKQLKASFRSPAPVLWACLVNFACIPVICLGMIWLQSPDDYKVGLMIAACVPCTMAAASVWTRKANGNDAVSLLVTLVTNSICFLITPLWLNLATRSIDLASSSGVTLDVKDMMIRLFQAVLIPVLLGQSVRAFPKPAAFATRYKTPIGVIAQMLILLLIFGAACGAGIHLQSDGTKPGLWDTVVVWVSCIAVHLVAMLIGFRGAKLFRFAKKDQVAVAFASSQKTLPISILLAEHFESAGLPFAVFPMLMYHASQLFIDTAVADRLAPYAETDTSSAADSTGLSDSVS